jgi:hypothetical protein
MEAVLSEAVGQFPSPQQVHMEMEDNLASLFVAVDRHAKTALVDTLPSRHFLRRPDHGRRHRQIIAGKIKQRGEMPFGNHHDMYRRHGMDIVKGQHFFILVNLLAGYGAFDNLAEDTIVHYSFLLFTIFDDIVKSPYAALRFILRHCDVRKSTPHSSGFARLASGAFYFVVSMLTFYEFTIFP